MPISAGDVILTFTADMSQLDAAFNKVANETAVKMTQATSGVSQSISSVGTGSLAAGQQVGVLGQQINSTIGSFTALAPEVDKTTESLHAGRGTLALFSEAVVPIPRHLRNFILELPGVGAALNAAFSAVAILFLIDILAKVIEKIQEFAGHAERVAEAWAKVDDVQRKALEGLEDNVIKAQIKLDELTGNHLEALRLKLELIDRTSLRNLQDQLGKIAKEAEVAFREMDHFGSSLQALLVGDKAPSEIGGEFTKVKKSVDDALNTRTPEAFANALKLLNGPDGEIEKAKKKLEDLEKQQQKIEKAPTTAGLPGGFVGPDLTPQIQAWQELKNRVDGYKTAIEDAQAAELKERKATNIEELRKIAAEKKKAAEDELRFVAQVAKAHEQADKQLDKENEADAKLHDVRLTAELKKENDAQNERLRLLHQEQEAIIAELDGELKHQELVDQQKADALKLQYDKGLISGREYLAKLKAMYSEDLATMTQILNAKERMVILEAQNEALKHGQILSTADAKELKAYVELENKKKQLGDEFNNKFLKSEDQVEKKLAKTYQTLGTLLDAYSKKVRAAEHDLQGFGKVADAVLRDISGAFGTAIEQWITGQESFGAALEKALQQYLAQVAGKAAIDALYFLAWGIADSFWNPARAGADFAAAAEFAGIAAVAGGAAAAMGKQGGAGGGSSSSTGPSVDSGSPANHPAQQPVSTINVAHLASGGLIDTPTFAMVHRNEAVLPFDNPQVMDAVRQGLGMGQPITVIVEGIPLHKLSRRMSSDQKKGKYRVHSTSSARTIRQY